MIAKIIIISFLDGSKKTSSGSNRTTELLLSDDWSRKCKPHKILNNRSHLPIFFAVGYYSLQRSELNDFALFSAVIPESSDWVNSTDVGSRFTYHTKFGTMIYSEKFVCSRSLRFPINCNVFQTKLSAKLGTNLWPSLVQSFAIHIGSITTIKSVPL